MFWAVISLQQWFFLFCLWCVAGASNALGVSPTLLTISPQSPIANLTLNNEQDEAVTIQLDVVQWTQNKEQELYAATDEVIATPQIFTLHPRSVQTIRLGLEIPVFGPQERAYRLFIQEVVPKLGKPHKNQLRMALRISLPVIIKAATPVHQHLKWRIETLHAGQLTISAENQGNNVLFINRLQAYSVKKNPITKSFTTFAYLLPGSKKVWNIPALTNKKVVSIQASINDRTSFINVD